MRKLVLLCASLFTMVLLISASPVLAQQVFWVSATGDDANTCQLAQPCATFQGAINRGGAVQINCLTSGNYGAFTLTSSMVIDCGTGNTGTVFNDGSGNFAITINTSSPVNIVLRHLNVNGNGTAAEGIFTANFASGSLTVEDCTVQAFTGGGIFFAPQSGRGLLQVSNTQVINNGGNGIVVQPSSGKIASVTLNGVEMLGNSDGLVLTGLGVIAGTMRNSIVGESGNNGVLGSATQVFFTVEELSIVDNLANGILTNSAGSSVKVGASTIGGNGTAVLASSGSIVSFGNNQISDNGSDGNFTSTKALK